MEDEILEILKKLPGLNCKQCGYNSCEELAGRIAKGLAKFEDCVVIKAGKKVILKIDDKEVPLGKFVQNFIKNVTLGMISSLKEVELKPGSTIELRFKVDEDDLR